MKRFAIALTGVTFIASVSLMAQQQPTTKHRTIKAYVDTAKVLAPPPPPAVPPVVTPPPRPKIHATAEPAEPILPPPPPPVKKALPAKPKS